MAKMRGISRRSLLAGVSLGALLSSNDARAFPSPPYNFTTMPSSSQVKLFGGNLTQVPIADGGPNTAYQYAWQYQNWTAGANVFNNWVKPAILNWKRRGGRQIRMFGGCDGVISGLYTQSYYESCLSSLIAFIRAQGMTLGMNGYCVAGYATVSGGPSLSNTAAWYAPMQSAIANVFNPNADVMAYLEIGNQETNLYGSSDETLSAALCTLGSADTAIPTLLSSTSDFSWIPTTCDLIGFHFYPQLTGVTLTFNGINSAIVAAMRSRPSNNLSCKMLLEEFGYNETTFVNKTRLLNTAFRTNFGHPDVIGATPWGGQGPSPDGDWELYNLPSNTFDPTSDWTDTTASILYAAWGPGNRNVAWQVQLSSSTTVTSSAADVGVDWVTGGTPSTEAGANLSTVLQTNVTLTLTGTISLTGDPGSQYTISLIANDTIFTGRHVVGTPLVITGSVTNQAISISGTLPLPGPGPSGTQWTFTVQAQRTSGSVDGTITAMTTTVAFGVAPALNPPASTPVFGVLSSAMATKLARMRNTRPTRRQFLVLDDGSVEREA
jgi:hypothetical protein